MAETRPELAETLAPRLPDALVSAAMAEVGQAAAQGQTPPQSAMQRLRQLARVEPLRADPFLVQAAIAQRSGNTARAEQLLLEARRRDPRSAAARYLLAEAWLREGRIADGLGELAMLAHLLPGSSIELVPALAQYAQSPGAREQLARILSSNPQLKQPLLNALAADPANLELILHLDGSVASPTGTRSPLWQARLINALIGQGAYERAYALWQRLAGHRGARPLLFNGDFRRVSAPPPFNWNFASGRAGFAEPANGRMRVLFYGRENAALASQLLLLPAGTYRFSVSLSGSASPGALAWVVSCAPSRKSLMQLGLGSATSAQASFDVPAGNCPAQSLELRGRAQDMPRESDLLVGTVAIERVGR